MGRKKDGSSLTSKNASGQGKKAVLQASTIRRFLSVVLAYAASSTTKRIIHGLGQGTNTVKLSFVLGRV